MICQEGLKRIKIFPHHYLLKLPKWGIATKDLMETTGEVQGLHLRYVTQIHLDTLSWLLFWALDQDFVWELGWRSLLLLSRVLCQHSNERWSSHSRAWEACPGLWHFAEETPYSSLYFKFWPAPGTSYRVRVLHVRRKATLEMLAGEALGKERDPTSLKPPALPQPCSAG